MQLVIDQIDRALRFHSYFTKTTDCDKYNGYQYNLSGNYYKLYLDHLS